MGLLDDAIREHLELKRRRGADAGEISRAEREALGAVQRGPDGEPDLASIPDPPPPTPPLGLHDEELPAPDADSDWAGETAVVPAAPLEPDYEPPPVPSASESPLSAADREPPVDEPPPVPSAYETPAAPAPDPPAERDALYVPPAERDPVPEPPVERDALYEPPAPPAAEEPPTATHEPPKAPPAAAAYVPPQPPPPEPPTAAYVPPPPPPAYEPPPAAHRPPPAAYEPPPPLAYDEHPPGFEDLDEPIAEPSPAPPRGRRGLRRLLRRGGDDPPTATPTPGSIFDDGNDPPTLQRPRPGHHQPLEPLHPPAPPAHEPPPAHGRAAEEPKGEDLLEETPEFLEETPDHDRLWFEQRPPRDFDFDK